MPQLLVALFEILYVKKCQEVRSEADQELTVRAILRGPPSINLALQGADW